MRTVKKIIGVIALWCVIPLFGVMVSAINGDHWLLGLIAGILVNVIIILINLFIDFIEWCFR